MTHRTPARFGPAIEALEDRRVMSVIGLADLGRPHWDHATVATAEAGERLSARHPAEVRSIHHAAPQSRALADAPIPWPMFHHDAQHTGIGLGTINVATGLKFRWKAQLQSQPDVSSPAIGPGGNMVFIADTLGRVYGIIATGAAAGTIKWTRPTGAIIASSPAVAQMGKNVRVFIGNDNGIFYALNAVDGGILWQYAARAVIVSSPTISPVAQANAVAFASLGGHVFDLNAATGAVNWDYPGEGKPGIRFGVAGSPAFSADGNTVYVVSRVGTLYAIQATGKKMGTLLWSVPSGGLQVLGSPAISPDGKTLYFAGSVLFNERPLHGKLVAVDLATHKIKWTYSTISPVIQSSPAVSPDNQRVIFGTAGPLGEIAAVAAQTGGTSWYRLTFGDINSSPAFSSDGKSVVIGGGDKKVYLLEATTGRPRVTPYRTGGNVKSSPAIGADGTVYIGSNDGFLYALGGPPG
jgi:outer membrane protein assembly factor BamB